ncbi:MAG: FHA domain-containing protein [Anaerolineae bacterium]|nr:FHA domain-containing protein [Anaerolineae bacterium]
MPTAPCLHVKEGDRPGTQIDLNTFPFTIGRARECHFVIDSPDVSRLHVEFGFDHQQVYIMDMGSTNGTYLNHHPLEPRKQAKLRAGDEINIGNVMTLVFDDPATTAQIAEVRLPIPGLRLDDSAAQVYINGERLDPPLSPSQFTLLSLLVNNEDAVVTREDIRKYVWGMDYEVNDQTIDALVSRLRKRLLEVDPEHDYLITRRGFGLMFRNKRLKG